jgi:uncharacterized protein YqjF (DUF2071 family)
MWHRWESLLFLHWRLPAARIQETLPPGLTVDTYNGEAYLAIVPFFMRNVRPVGLPSISFLSHFQELNVRTYVYDRDGVPGVWFYSLDCNQPAAVAGARLLTGLRYFHAEMTAATGEFIDYTSRRKGTAGSARYRYRGIGPAREADPASLEFFLLDRYYLYAQRGRSLIRAQVSHERYSYRDAEVAECSPVPAQLDGFPELAADPSHRCYVEGFDVMIYATQVLR